MPLMGRLSKLLPQSMEREIMSRCTRTINTIFMKTKILELSNDAYQKAGKSLNGLLVHYA